jgi:hypothetical protein
MGLERAQHQKTELAVIEHSAIEGNCGMAVREASAGLRGNVLFPCFGGLRVSA